jgi:predicted Zn-dependent protease
MICVAAVQKQPFFPVQQGRPSDQALDRAMFALRTQRPAEAEQLAAGVLKANRGNVRAAVIHGQALLAQNRAEEAIVSLQKAARRSDDPTLATVLASALTAAGRAEESLVQLRKVIARRPPFPPAS